MHFIGTLCNRARAWKIGILPGDFCIMSTFMKLIISSNHEYHFLSPDLIWQFIGISSPKPIWVGNSLPVSNIWECCFNRSGFERVSFYISCMKRRIRWKVPCIPCFFYSSRGYSYLYNVMCEYRWNKQTTNNMNNVNAGCNKISRMWNWENMREL